MSSNNKNRSGTPRSQRQLRVGEEIRHAMSEVLNRTSFNDPNLEGVIITISEVRISPDLKNATAFVVPLGGADLDAVTKSLNKANGFFRRELSHMLRLRSCPRIGFEPDTSFDEAAKINTLLQSDSVQQDLLHNDDESLAESQHGNDEADS
ncbi:ribosome-binding factor A [Kiloniella spongiae]|uniref:Ribosome-binding factor A n=1 Tax=Kiloniella spongiae TaxID=1489064 RepID=A0A0H2MJQ1_9PROT|nr:30S ribosome-binding factor RbfA [Kiloniella spongiae]KLN60962.1 ribosome-binding factor A [Kiloniella spongiae]